MSICGRWLRLAVYVRELVIITGRTFLSYFKLRRSRSSDLAYLLRAPRDSFSIRLLYWPRMQTIQLEGSLLLYQARKIVSVGFRIFSECDWSDLCSLKIA